MYNKLLYSLVTIVFLGSCLVEVSPKLEELSLPFENPKRVIYQLVVRYFGNTNTNNIPNGTIDQNGVGKFNDINDAALESLKDMGVTDIYLMGVIRHATLTDYSTVDPALAADDPDIVKGRAGSPFAIKDYYDVDPDLAVEPANRMQEFENLVKRIHAHGLRVIIDLVPNHVARSYHSIIYPERDFGINDDRTPNVFNPNNNFFYVSSTTSGCTAPDGYVSITYKSGYTPPVSTGRDHLFNEPSVSVGCRATGDAGGNSSAGSCCPDGNSFYETVRLNYGYDYYEHTKIFLINGTVPDTWIKMDQIIAYWQSKGVDGFRVDFVFTTPPEFWNWAISRARERDPDVYFIGEFYDGSPYYYPSPDRYEYLHAGFDALYWKGGTAALYDTLKAINNGSNWANDLDEYVPTDYFSPRSVTFVENHDEVRIASTKTGHHDYWGSIGMWLGVPVSTILYTVHKGPILMLNGQEVGEPGDGAEGFELDQAPENARTTFFDYWGMPEFVKWVNNHNYDGALLSDEQKQLRSFYKSLLNLLTTRPALYDGNFYGLNYFNKGGDVGGWSTGGSWPEGAAFGDHGHWMYAFLRYTSNGSDVLLVVANLNPTTTYYPKIVIPEEAVNFAYIDKEALYKVEDILWKNVDNPRFHHDVVYVKGKEFYKPGFGIPLTMPPLSAFIFEIRKAQ